MTLQHVFAEAACREYRLSRHENIRAAVNQFRTNICTHESFRTCRAHRPGADPVSQKMFLKTKPIRHWAKASPTTEGGGSTKGSWDNYPSVLFDDCGQQQQQHSPQTAATSEQQHQGHANTIINASQKVTCLGFMLLCLKCSCVCGTHDGVLSEK